MSTENKLKTSIALKYDHSGAPTIAASGSGYLGREILDRARDANVPVVEDAKLAGLLSMVPIGDEIPTELYQAVAEVLVFVLRLELTLDESA